MYFRIFTPLFLFLGLSLAAPIDGNVDVAKRETVLNAFLAALLEYLPSIDDTIQDLVTVLTDFEELLADFTGLQTSTYILHFNTSISVPGTWDERKMTHIYNPHSSPLLSIVPQAPPNQNINLPLNSIQ